MVADGDSAALEAATVAGLAAVIAEFRHAWLGPVGTTPVRDAPVDVVLELLWCQAKRRAARIVAERHGAEMRKRA